MMIRGMTIMLMMTAVIYSFFMGQKSIARSGQSLLLRKQHVLFQANAMFFCERDPGEERKLRFLAVIPCKGIIWGALSKIYG
jgi:hypothetical protein